MPMPDSEPARTFVPGPPVSPPGPLLTWLNESADAAPERLVRLPVAIRLDSLRLGIDSAAIGVGPSDDAGPGTIRLTLNDGAMGVPLTDRLRALCPPGRQDCTVWLDGLWGLPGGAFPQEGRQEPDGGIRAVFSPVTVADTVTPGQRPEKVHAFVEE